VPELQFTFTVSKSFSRETSSRLWIFTVFGFKSIFCPFLAKSYDGLPLYFTDEYTGGVCLIFPVNLFRIPDIFLISMFLILLLAKTSPSRSHVSVITPSFISAIYSLLKDKK